MLSNGWCYFQLGGGGMSGNVGGMSPNAFVGFYLRGAFKKKTNQHRKDIIQQESLVI